MRPEPLGDGADLAFAGDQRRSQHQHVAHGADHEILLEKGGLEGARAAQARRAVDRRKVDAGGEPDRSDVEPALQHQSPDMASSSLRPSAA